MTTKRLDANQVLKQVYDEVTNRLRTDAVINAEGAEIEIDAADGDNIAINDGTNTLVVNPDGSINVAFSSSSQIEIDAADGDNIAISDGTDTLAINDDGTIDIKNITGTVSLPTGAATEAKQDIGNTSLASIDTKLTDKSQFTKLTDGTDTALITASGELNVLATAQPGVDIGDVTINNGSGVNAVNIQDGGNSITVDGTVAATQSGTWNITNITGTVSLPTGAATEATLATRLSESTFTTRINTQGQKTMALSTPVVMASDQPTFDMERAISGIFYNVSFDANAAVSGTDNPLLLITNPLGSGKSLYFSVFTIGCTVTNVAASFKIFSGPTITANGSAATIVNRNIGGSNPSSVVSAFSLPTLSSNGTQLTTMNAGQNAGAVVFEFRFGLILRPNNSLILTANPASNNRNMTLSTAWIEL